MSSTGLLNKAKEISVTVDKTSYVEKSSCKLLAVKLFRNEAAILMLYFKCPFKAHLWYEVCWKLSKHCVHWRWNNLKWINVSSSLKHIETRGFPCRCLAVLLSLLCLLSFSFIVGCSSSHNVSCLPLVAISMKRIFCDKLQYMTYWDPLPGPFGVTEILRMVAIFCLDIGL